MANQPTLLVTGASGQLGRRAAELLLEAKAGKIVAGTRNPEKIKDLAASGAEIRKVDVAEQALAESGIGWTVLRNSWYQENLFHSLPQVLASGKWFSAAGDGKVAHVSREDAAYAAAAALAAKPNGNARYDITGSDLLTTKDIAKLASEATGKPIEVVNVTDEQLTQGMIAAGMPAFLAPVFASFDTNTRNGNIAIASDAVQKLTGRAPRSLKQFFTANKEALLHAH